MCEWEKEMYSVALLKHKGDVPIQTKLSVYFVAFE